MKTINAHQHQVIDRSYRGSIENAPMWLRAIVAPWYRRFLMWPFTVYLVVLGGVAAGYVTEGWAGFFVSSPAYVLLLVIASKAQLLWYADRYDAYEKKHPTPPEKPIRIEPIVKKRKTRKDKGIKRGPLGFKRKSPNAKKK